MTSSWHLLGASASSRYRGRHDHLHGPYVYWLDAVVLLLIGVGMFFALNWLDARARLLPFKGGWSIKRLRGNPTPQIALLLSPQAAVLSAFAALVERGLLTPTATGFVPAGTLRQPRGELETAVFACFTVGRGTNVTVESLLADDAVRHALEEHTQQMKDKRMIRSFSPLLLGLVELAMWALFLTIGVLDIMWRAPYEGHARPAAGGVLVLGGFLFLILAIASFRNRDRINPGVSSEVSSMRHRYRTGQLVHSNRGGGYHETGVALLGSWAFTRFWPEQAALLRVRDEPVIEQALELFDTPDLTPPKKRWPDPE